MSLANNKKFAMALTSVVFLFTLVGGLLASFASANFIPPPPPPHIYITSNGTVYPQSSPIQKSGSLYTITGNLTKYTLEVQKDNVIVNGAGYTLEGDFQNPGIVLQSRNNVTIKNMEIKNTGITISNSSNNVVFNNSFEIGTCVLDSTSSGNQVTKNNFTLYGGYAINCAGSFNNFSSNRIISLPAYDEHGIRMYNGFGIKLDGSSNTISENYFEVADPIMLNKASSNTISGNILLGGYEGIALVEDSSNNIVFRNNLTAFGTWAILMGDGTGNVFYENNVADSGYGVALGGYDTNIHADNNTFFHNNFLNNTKHVGKNWPEYGSNIWDNGEEGNFWSDYNVTDNNHDGIDDSPYIIDATNIDHYPLMAPYQSASTSAGFQLALPEEYLNYTISTVNGTLWAKIDGTYPMHMLSEYGLPQLPMVYPTPPNTTNIHIWLDDAELNWSNFSEIDPTATHHTDIGDWQMIYALVAPSSPDFVLKIHYEHPVQVINGTYTFLYDLNISPYLSPSFPNSTAHFSIRVETNCSGVNVYATGFNGTWNPINYTRVEDSNVKTIAFDVMSEYGKPLGGDIAFSLLDAQVPEFPAGIVAAVAAVTVCFAVFGTVARKKF